MKDKHQLSCALYMKNIELLGMVKSHLENNQLHCTFEESSLNEAIVGLNENQVDLLIIGVNELAMLPLLAREHETVKIVVVSENEDTFEENLRDAITKGANSFLPWQTDNFIQQLYKVNEESYYFPTTVMEKFITMYKKAAVYEKREEKEFRKPLHLLTRRECEVLQLLAEGKSNREVGELLYISEKTVKNHVSNILMKLKVKDRTKAVLMAIKKSWVHVS
jgi:two-component system, NarL family, response regulator DegU